MVELKISGCCKNCRNIDLRLKESSIWVSAIDHIPEKINAYSIACIHEAVCAALEKEMSNGEADENIQSP